MFDYIMSSLVILQTFAYFHHNDHSPDTSIQFFCLSTSVLLVCNPTFYTDHACGGIWDKNIVLHKSI